MGHYDEHHASAQQRDTERAAKLAAAEAKRLAIPLLGDSHFEPIGVCAKCAATVRSIPNWGCKRGVCPHRP